METSSMKVVIMAGGRGTRISELFPDIPKPMIPVCGIPVLEREISSLKEQGFTDIILTVGYKAESIMQHFGDGRKYGVQIEYFVEKEPLGNAGALFRIKDKLTEDFLLLNADAMFNVDFNRFVKFHKAHNGLVTLFTHPNNHPYDSGLIVANKEKKVEQWLTKEDKRPKYYQNRVNAGLHVINPEALDLKVTTDKVDLDRQVLKPLCSSGKIYCYDSPEYVKDMGTPERYETVCKDFENGTVEARNLKNKQKAIFLDRDGTINKYVGFLRNIEQFELLSGVSEAIRKINQSGYLAVVVTNQPVIARGEVTYTELQEIHNKMETILGKDGAYLDGIYFCPHHPDKGFKGEVKELKINCNCRKPNPGLLLQAASDFNINLEQSWMIGDGKNDIQAGKNAGCKTVLIGDDEFGQDITVYSLLEFVNQIVC
jgi:D-glycero-D-manno-heptose 1,7-bisphosphate phosphatase